jgi:hypothetical protein
LALPVLARKPGVLRNGAPFRDWVLPAALERVRRRLAGSDDGDRQMVAILPAVLTDGLPAVEAACAQAMAEGAHSSDVIINILTRQRDPGPSAVILTPEALTLRHLPVADCVGYGQPRSRRDGADQGPRHTTNLAFGEWPSVRSRVLVASLATPVSLCNAEVSRPAVGTDAVQNPATPDGTEDQFVC